MARLAPLDSDSPHRLDCKLLIVGDDSTDSGVSGLRQEISMSDKMICRDLRIIFTVVYGTGVRCFSRY